MKLLNRTSITLGLNLSLGLDLGNGEKVKVVKDIDHNKIYLEFTGNF